ncbi:MAG: hypothetical protein IJA59_06400 [Clostridia bacterium]|nr:hypothetical protein [Clostridia bacterium]
MQQADHAARDRARETGKKKGPEAEGRACSYIRIQPPFSHSLPKQANQKIGFRGNEIHRCPLADKGGCSSNEAQSAEGFSLLRDNAELWTARGRLLP